MTDIHKLLKQIAAQEDLLRSTQFLAPCVRGGQVRTRVAGMVYSFTPKPADFEGWGIFQPEDEKVAAIAEEASLPHIAEYLKHWQSLRFWLVQPLRKRTWLAYPAHEADARQRFDLAKPVPVHLVEDGAPFEAIVARWDGAAWWFDAIDRRSDPHIAELLKANLKQLTLPEQLQFKGLTPEMRIAYDLATQQAREFEATRKQRQDERRLREALRRGGGELQEFRDRQDHWTVEWTTADGERHSSAISKNDLTVISSGICLSGRDRDFDLQSLVGVIEQRGWD